MYVSLPIGAQVLVTLKLRPRRASAVFGENRKAVSFFYKYDQTKDFLDIWRMQYYSIGTQD